MIIFKASQKQLSNLDDLIVIAAENIPARHYALEYWGDPNLLPIDVVLVPIGLTFAHEPEARSGVLVGGAWRQR